MSLEGIADLLSGKNEADNDAPVFWFKLPPPLAKETGIYSIGFRQTTAQQEIDCMNKAQGDRAKNAYELAKAGMYGYYKCKVTSVVLKVQQGDKVVDVPSLQVDREGEVCLLHAADGSVDKFFARRELSKVRALCLLAYTRVNAPDSDDTASFLSSMEVTV